MALLISRVVLIANPASRSGTRKLAAAEAAFGAHGVECTVARTTHAGHEAALAAEAAAGVDAVFVLGGDGTVMNVSSALAGSGVPIGIVPSGTGNLLAGELRIPRSPRRAIAALLRGVVRPIDLASVAGGRHFAFAAGMGIDATMVQHTSSASKRRWGMLGYAVVAARAALRPQSFHVTAEVDGTIAYRGPATLAMVVNGGSLLGGLLTFGPGVAPDDGYLDLCIYSPKSARDAVAIVWRLLRRNFRSDPRLHFARGREMRLRAEPVQLFESDGELVSQSPVQVSVVPHAASFLVPGRVRASSGVRQVAASGGDVTLGISAPQGIGYDSAVARRSDSTRGGAT